MSHHTSETTDGGVESGPRVEGNEEKSRSKNGIEKTLEERIVEKATRAPHYAPAPDEPTSAFTGTDIAVGEILGQFRVSTLLGTKVKVANGESAIWEAPTYDRPSATGPTKATATPRPTFNDRSKRSSEIRVLKKKREEIAIRDKNT